MYRHYHNQHNENDMIRNRSYIVYDMKNYVFENFIKLFNDMHIFTAIKDCKDVTSFTIYMTIKTADTQYNVTKTIDNNEEFVSILNDLDATIGKIIKMKKC